MTAWKPYVPIFEFGEDTAETILWAVEGSPLMYPGDWDSTAPVVAHVNERRDRFRLRVGAHHYEISVDRDAEVRDGDWHGSTVYTIEAVTP